MALERNSFGLRVSSAKGAANFEPAEGGDGEGHAVEDAGDARRARPGIQRCRGTGAWAGMDQEGDPEREHEEELKRSHDHCGTRADAYAPVGKAPNQEDERPPKEPPGDVDAGIGLEDVRHEEPKEAKHGGWCQRVIGKVTPRGEESPARSESLAHEREIAATRRDVAREFGDRVRDDKSDQDGQSERYRHGCASVEGDERKEKHDAD